MNEIIMTKINKRGNKITLQRIGNNYCLTVDSPVRYCCMAFNDKQQAINHFNSK